MQCPRFNDTQVHSRASGPIGLLISPADDGSGAKWDEVWSRGERGCCTVIGIWCGCKTCMPPRCDRAHDRCYGVGLAPHDRKGRWKHEGYYMVLVLRAVLAEYTDHTQATVSLCFLYH